MNEVYTDFEKVGELNMTDPNPLKNIGKVDVYEAIKGCYMPLEEIEKIRIEDYNRKAIYYRCIIKENPMDSKWEIWNCRFELIASKFLCQAYFYGLGEAITLANEHFYAKEK